MRKHWIDNLRWVTVLLVLLYHVFYFFNNKGVFGGIGGFGTYPECPQYQDVVMYFLYPWFMPLLFLLAGVSAKYALDKLDGKTWFKARTRKLLVPATIGLLVFQWMTGYFNVRVASVAQGMDLTADIPGVLKYFAWSINGIGHLWFIQDLWLFSIVLLILKKLDPSDKLHAWCGKLFENKTAIVWLILLGVFFWAGEHTQKMDLTALWAGLYNLYKPFFYLILFLLGYYVFSHNHVHETLAKYWMPLMVIAIASCAWLVATTFGEINTTPQYLASPKNCLFGWFACLAMMAWFKVCFDKTSAFASYMTRSSFGIYVVHYLVIGCLGYMMKMYTTLPPVAIYVILTIAVFALSPLIFEILRRIPIVRWCVLGEKGKK
jgi:surface polysaccharide O-acyltransferase-like enzyme